ncbi:hypothetical protein ABIE58_003412 [Roseovarius sp. MBR-78]|uniref:hypothetical protein n=1 Tax=Roseovarius sp. MBR-78 TaxID=3156460 RepID=UPI003397200B
MLAALDVLRAYVEGSVPARPQIKKNDIIQVGEFFWIKDDLIGVSDDAEHAHHIYDGGSADQSCRIQVLSVEGETVVAKLLRDSVPYGAEAAHGLLFRLSVEQITRWITDSGSCC